MTNSIDAATQIIERTPVELSWEEIMLMRKPDICGHVHIAPPKNG